MQGYGDLEESGQHNTPKGAQETSRMDPREMAIQELPDKGFKIIVLKMLRELQENIVKQFSEIRSKNTRTKWKEVENIKIRK